MSLECKINIDLDKGIIDFSKENIDEKVNIQGYIEKIVKSVAKNCHTHASKAEYPKTK